MVPCLKRLPWMVILGMALAVVALAGPLPAHAQAPEPHQYIDEYVGPSTCAACHGDITTDVMHTVHYSWDEKMDHYSPVAGSIARINWLGILNSHLNIPGGCARCHIGAGNLPVPASQATEADRAGIDCLVCHSPVYDTGLRFPVQEADGTWSLIQDRNVLTARQAQRPTTENCLFCHLNVGGGAMLKRGVDFAPVPDKHGEASKGDVHAEAGMSCIDCHRSQDHKIMGYGPTLWSRDLPDQRLTCQGCHGAAPHQDVLLNGHSRVDCRTCHVLGTGGLVSRDWTAPPVYDPVTELYAPVGVEQEPNTEMPVYRWFNGDPVLPGQPWPGERTDERSHIQPFKQFDAVVPVDARSGQPIPLKLSIFYTQGDVEKAIQVGAEESGMAYSGSWRAEEMQEYLQISHGVVGKEDALYCQACHVPDGRIDFAAMGYVESEVALYGSLSAADAGPRRPLQMQVAVPESVPLPTPVSLSGELAATRGRGLRVPWDPILALLASLGIVGGAGGWLWRQRPGKA